MDPDLRVSGCVILAQTCITPTTTLQLSALRQPYLNYIESISLYFFLVIYVIKAN